MDSHVFADADADVCLCGEPAESSVHVQGAGADLLRLRGAIGRLYRQGAAAYTPSHLALMLCVLAAGSVRPSTLWNRERVSKPTVTNSVDFLVRHGHLVRTDGGVGDRRSHRIAATPSGERGVGQVLALMERRAALLTPAERELLHAAVPLLERLAQEEPMFRLSSSLDRFASG